MTGTEKREREREREREAEIDGHRTKIFHLASKNGISLKTGKIMGEVGIYGRIAFLSRDL